MNSDQITKKDIQNFLQEESLGTLAMLKPDGKPDAVGVYYVAEDFKLYTITKKETAKCKNILAHDDVVFVITNLETQTTLKYIGKASIIENN